MNREINRCSAVFEQLNSKIRWHFVIPTQHLWKTLQTRCPGADENDFWVGLVCAGPQADSCCSSQAPCFCAGERTQCCQNFQCFKGRIKFGYLCKVSRISNTDNFILRKGSCVLKWNLPEVQMWWEGCIFGTSWLTADPPASGVPAGFSSIPCEHHWTGSNTLWLPAQAFFC